MFKGDTTAFSIAIGGGGVTFPWWSSFIVGWEVLIAIGGAIVIGLTIWNKVLEIKQRKRDLKK